MRPSPRQAKWACQPQVLVVPTAQGGGFRSGAYLASYWPGPNQLLARAEFLPAALVPRRFGQHVPGMGAEPGHDFVSATFHPRGDDLVPQLRRRDVSDGRGNTPATVENEASVTLPIDDFLFPAELDPVGSPARRLGGWRH